MPDRRWDPARRGWRLLLALALLGPAAPVRAQGLHELLAAQVRAGNATVRIEADRPGKCGFGPAVAVIGALGRGASAVQDERPTDLDRSFPSPGGFFLLHYTDTGTDAVPPEDVSGTIGVPDFIEAAAAAFDSVLAGYRALGWTDPIGDGDACYDVYFKDWVQQQYLFGVTWPAPPYRTTPPYQTASWMELDNDYPTWFYGHPPLTSLRVTFAHEFHHAIQLAHNLNVFDWDAYYLDYAWFAEASATFHEEVFYDGINDYRLYLPAFLNAPELGLTSASGNHPYGAVLWPLYLEASEGPGAIRELWETMADEGVSPQSAHHTFFTARGSVWDEAWREFTVWLLHTGSRADPLRYFEEGRDYPEVRIRTADSWPTQLTLPALAVRYWRSSPDSTRAGGALRVLPGLPSAWGAGLAGETLTVPQRVSTAGSPGRGAGVELLDWTAYEGVLGWALTGANDTGHPDSLVSRSAEVELDASDRLSEQQTDGASFRLFQNYPNPFRPVRDGQTHFVFRLETAGPVELEVRSLGGARLWSHRFASVDPGLHFSADLGMGWDGRDSQGHPAPSGVYLIVGRAGGRTEVLKFSVLR